MCFRVLNPKIVDVMDENNISDKAANFLRRMQTIAENGFNVRQLGALRNDLSNANPQDAKAAVIWAITQTTNPTTIWWMSAIAEQHEILEALPLLVEHLKGLPQRSGLRDYRDDVRSAIRQLQSLSKGNCACKTAQGLPSSRPEITVDHSKVVQRCCMLLYYVHCHRCGQRFEVEEDGSYHYPIFRWSSKKGKGPWKTVD